MLSEENRRKIVNSQINEITEYFIYRSLSQSVKDRHNREILERVAADELKHYNFWKEFTQVDVKPSKLKMWIYLLISKVFGIMFGLKLMEKGEDKASTFYNEISKGLPGAKEIIVDEEEHEKQLIDMIDEEKLRYVGSIILGLNDALVELTGALAGFTLALQNASLIAMAGLITGIAGSLSMAASEYLSTKSEEGSRSPFKASVYTGLTYVGTVLFLIFPYFLLPNIYFSLALTILNGIVVIFVFTFYVSITKDIPFKKRFLEMISISLGIATLTFVIGFLVRAFLSIEI